MRHSRSDAITRRNASSRRKLTRRKLLERRRLFAAQGYAATTLPAIAREAGVSPADGHRRVRDEGAPAQPI